MTRPIEADEGPYKIGTLVMVNRTALQADVRNPLLPEWFPAIVCEPPRNDDGWLYRWYDPFIWMKTEADVWKEDAVIMYPKNMFYSGSTYYEGVLAYREPWVWPVETWKEYREHEVI